MHVGVLAIALTDSRAIASSEAKRQSRSRERALIVQIGTLNFYTWIINYVEVDLSLCSCFISAPAISKRISSPGRSFRCLLGWCSQVAFVFQDWVCVSAAFREIVLQLLKAALTWSEMPWIRHYYYYYFNACKQRKVPRLGYCVLWSGRV